MKIDQAESTNLLFTLSFESMGVTKRKILSSASGHVSWFEVFWENFRNLNSSLGFEANVLSSPLFSAIGYCFRAFTFVCEVLTRHLHLRPRLHFLTLTHLP